MNRVDINRLWIIHNTVINLIWACGQHALNSIPLPHILANTRDVHIFCELWRVLPSFVNTDFYICFRRPPRVSIILGNHFEVVLCRGQWTFSGYNSRAVGYQKLLVWFFKRVRYKRITTGVLIGSGYMKYYMPFFKVLLYIGYECFATKNWIVVIDVVDSNFQLTESHQPLSFFLARSSVLSRDPYLVGSLLFTVKGHGSCYQTGSTVYFKVAYPGRRPLNVITNFSVLTHVSIFSTDLKFTRNKQAIMKILLKIH